MASDDEDELELCRFGTPLDPIEEDSAPTTKKITLADQIATDNNGKRRFHGAFTGGFSAGFWNTVGSREGWTPSEFKSSRGEKATHRIQKASDFMDDEDVGEFGIAPQRIQTTEDFGPSESKQRNKRKLQTNTTQGPIPGVPVLELVLESCHDKAAVRLLKRMDKRYAITLSQKPKRSPSPIIEKPDDEPMKSDGPEHQENSETMTQEKVYKCDMGPMQWPKRDIEANSSDEDDDDDDDGLVFDKDEFDLIFENFKINRFGLGYSGLEKGNFFATVGSEVPIIQNDYNSLSTFTMEDQNKKKVTIRGQAFGVGAFEEDDDDIYGRDDMTKYDFRLDNQIEKRSSKNSKINERGYVSGFCDASAATRIAKKYVFKVSLPFSFEPRNWLKRKSRFGPEVATASTSMIRGPSDKVIGRHDLTPDQRGQLLGDKTVKNDSVNDIDAKLKAAGLKPMDFTSGGIENKTDNDPTSDELGIKIEENLLKIRNKNFVVPEGIPNIFDRFTTSSENKPQSEVDSKEIKEIATAPVAAAAPKEVKKVIRTKSIWIACELLCYKMNMETNVGTKPEKGNTFSLFKCVANMEAGRRKELEFTNTKRDTSDEAEIKQIMERSKAKSSASTSHQTEKFPSTQAAQVVQQSPPGISESISKTETDGKSESSVVKRPKPKTELEMKIFNAQDEHPSKKKDIFKAIFDSDSESENSDEENDESIISKKLTINADLMSTLTKQSTATTALYAQLPDTAFKPKSAREINILRNTSPPRGIFSGLTRKTQSSTETITSEQKSTEKTSNDDTPDTYGPNLPPMKPLYSKNDKAESSTKHTGLSSTTSISLGKTKVFYKEKWIEKSDEKEKKSKKEKKHKHKSKKDKKEKKKKKK